MTVYFIRHGETDLNRQNIVQGSGMDSDLNELGRAQALAFFEAHQYIDFELVVTSRLKRTHQTVQHFIDRNIPWIQTADLNEISWGRLEGESPTPERYHIFRKLIRDWQNGQLDASAPGGESARQLTERVSRFLDWLRERPEQFILVATHGRTLRVLITLLKGLAVSEMEAVSHVNTGCFIVEFSGENVVFHIENDMTHLEKAQLPVIR